MTDTTRPAAPSTDVPDRVDEAAIRAQIRDHLASSESAVCALTTACLNGKMVEALGLFGYLRQYVRADGMQLWDADGRCYVDFLAGYGSVPLGHNHPVVRAAIAEVLESELPHFPLMAPEALPAALGARLRELLPGELGMSFLASSGSEAVDGALKLARAATRRERFVYAERGYHGTTFGALSVTGDDGYRRPFGPLVEPTTRVPWGDVDAIAAAVRKRDVAAVILEPIQAEGGIRVPPPGYHRAVAEVCRRYGTLLVHDEVQTGLGRTGAMFACAAEGVTPDVVVLAKGLSGGMVPISAYVTTPDIWSRAYGTLDRHELHCSTYRGGPLACAAALATLSVIGQPGFVAQVARVGDQLGAALHRATGGHALVREVRGRGLLWGVELATPDAGIRADLIAQWLVVGLLERGVVTQVGSLASNVVRVEPPLIATREHIELFADALADTLANHSTGKLTSMVGAASRLVRGQLGKLNELPIVGGLARLSGRGDTR